MKNPTGDEVFILEKSNKDPKVWELFCDPIYDSPEDRVLDEDLDDSVIVGRAKVVGRDGVPYLTNVLFTPRGGAYIRSTDLRRILSGK